MQKSISKIQKIIVVLLLILFLFLMPDVWGTLPKSQTDSELIEAAIDRKIAAHNDDPTAHTGATGAITNHRTDTIIDHPAESIVEDKLYHQEHDGKPFLRDRFSIPVNLADIADFNFDGSSFGRQGYAEFSTGATTNFVYSGIIPGEENSGWFLDFDKNPYVSFFIFPTQSTSQKIEVGMGWMNSDSGYGFYILNNAVYARWYDTSNAAHDTLLSGISAHAQHRMSVQVYSGSSVEWYVDGALVHTETITGSHPSGNGFPPVAITIAKTTSSNRVLAVNDILFIQDYP